MKVNILDCTLRDGGYVNNWKFSNKQIKNIISSLEKASIDIIECGYLDDQKGSKSNSTLFNTIERIDKLLTPLNITANKVIMINLGSFAIQNLPNKKTTQIDGIRLAFHKKDLTKAIKMGLKIIALGYKLYFQPMVTKNYTNQEFEKLIKKVNKLNPYSFYIVDSFGSMTLKEFQSYLDFSNKKLNQNILLGYHSHNNMQLAFSNAINMCNSSFDREIIIDASIYGIGRGAGNLNTELIADYLNHNFNRNYNILPLLETIDSFLSSLMKKQPWGFSPAQYLSASFDCHPNYATYLINKNTNHIVGVHKVLEKLSDKNKVSFNEELIEKLYIASLLETKTAIKGELDIPTSKEVILVASGKSIKEHKKDFSKKLNNDKYIIIALNHKPDFKCNYYFFSNQKRFDEFKELIDRKKIVITSNISSKIYINTVLDITPLVFIKEKFITNVAVVAINYLVSQNITKVGLAGLDGYKVNGNNYNYKETSVITDNNELIEQNTILRNALKKLSKKIDIMFLTPSIFKKDI